MSVGIKLRYYHPAGNPTERHFEIPISMPPGTYISAQLKVAEVLSLLKDTPPDSDAYRLMSHLGRIERSDIKFVLEPFSLCIQGQLSDLDQIYPLIVRSVEAALGMDVEFVFRPAN